MNVAQPSGSGARPATHATAVPAWPAFGEPDGWRQHLGWLFAAVWLIYLWYPLSAVLDAGPLVARVLGTCGVVAFGAVFVVTFVATRSRRRAMISTAPWWVWLSLGAMVGITIGLATIVGQVSLAATIFTATLATMTLPTRQGWLMVVALAVGIVVASATIPGWDAPGFFLVQLFLSAFAGWGVSHLILYNLQLRNAREEISALAAVAERERLGRDIHDILGHSLTVITVKTELAGRLIDVDTDRARRELADVERLARQSLADVRSTAVGLREPTLAGELANARSALEAAGIAASLPGAVDEVPHDRQGLFAWVVREGVTNVVRHSKASRCRVVITPSSIEVTDDGIGLAARDMSEGGNGLAGLRSRVAAVGGSLSLARPDSGGLRLLVRPTR